MKYLKHLMTSASLLIGMVVLSTSVSFAQSLVTLGLPGIGSVDVLTTQQLAFDVVDEWEHYASGSGAQLGVENGVYRAYTPNPGYIWGLNASQHSDVVLEVDLTPLSVHGDTAAGIMCRADASNNGDGYYFMVNPNGYFSVSVSDGDQIVPLVDWQPSPAVRPGLDRNTIRAICLGNMLAMYLNDQLVATVEDNRFASGYTGIAVAAGSASADAAFDDLTIYTVSPQWSQELDEALRESA
jgi:hypothetical protein